MQLTPLRSRAASLTLALVFALSLMFGVVRPPAAYGQVHHMKHFAQKHRTATSVAAGIAAYQMAKRTGANRAAHGGHKNFMQRHPVMTGVAAGMATRHMLKKKHH